MYFIKCIISGVNIAKRAAAAAAKPTIEISEDNGTYTLKTMSIFKNTTISFKLGEEFDEETADGRHCKTVMVQDGNKLIQTQRIDPDESTTVREFSDAEMKVTDKTVHMYIVSINSVCILKLY